MVREKDVTGAAARQSVCLARRASLCFAMLLAAGCDTLLDVVPDQRAVDPAGEVRLEVALNGLEADFAQGNDLFIAWGDMFVDALTVTFTTCPSGIDCRRVPTTATHGRGATRGFTQSGNDPYYDFIHRPGAQASRLQEKMLEGEFGELQSDVENSAAFARVAVIKGFSREWASTFTCTVAFDGRGPEMTTQEGYTLAEAEFTKAIEAANAEPHIRQAAQAGRARVRLYLGDEEGAVIDASAVEPDFEFVTRYSTNTFEERNRLWFHMWVSGTKSVAEVFLNLTIDDTDVPDPRVVVAEDPVPAFNGVSTQWSAEKYSTPSAPVRVTSGDEAQYIIAEIQGGQSAVDIINAVRTRHGINIEWQPQIGSAQEIRDKVIDERRRTLFLEGTRFADVRRYLERYGLDFFPQPPHPLGFDMGDQTCIPLPDIERLNNPDL